MHCVKHILFYFFIALGLALGISAPVFAANFNYVDAPSSAIAFDEDSASCSAPLTRTFNVTDTFTVLDLDVGFLVSHTYRADIIVTLIAPDSTSVTIIDSEGGSKNHINAQLNSGASTSLSDSTSHSTSATPYQYTRSPTNSLSAFDGHSANGVWTLEVCDDANGDAGTYIQAELILVSDESGGGTVETGSYLDVPSTPITLDENVASCSGTPISRTFNITDSYTITDLNVGIIASHTYRGDIEITLTGPDLTSVTISNGVGGSRNNINVQFDSASSSSLNDGINHSTSASPYQYTRKPSSSLNAFNGKQINGAWVLKLCDNAGGDSGTYIRGEIIATYTLPPAELTASKSVAVYDPSAQGLYSVPGNDVLYTITVTNIGGGAADNNTAVLIDKIPSEVEFYNADIDDGGPETAPVSFSETNTTLTFTHSSDIAHSNSPSKPASFAACAYTPAAGYDSNVTYICFNPKGAMAGGTPSPSFSLTFRARIK